MVKKWISIFEDLTIVQLPLAFVRSGYIDLSAGRSYSVGNYGYGWSRVSQSTAFAYFLRMYPAVIYPSHYDDRWLGFPLRASTIVQLPLAFVRSGYVGIDAGNSRWVGNGGYGWSRASQSTTGAYYLLINPTGVNSSDYFNRWLGFPLCFSPSSTYP